MRKENLYLFILLFPWFFLACGTGEAQKTNSDFIAIFDGKTLKGWAGDSTYWSVENGAIVGRITPETLLKKNSFLIWQGGQPADFELKGEFNISESANSGINYRSELFTAVPNALKGYQADIDGKHHYTGQNYEERGRATLAYIGERTTILPQAAGWSKDSLRSRVKNNAWQDRKVEETFGEKEELVSTIKTGWNSFRIVANGPRLQHYINGKLMSDVTDEDTINGKIKGYLGVQVHVGPPMKVMYKNLWLKEL